MIDKSNDIVNSSVALSVVVRHLEQIASLKTSIIVIDACRVDFEVNACKICAKLFKDNDWANPGAFNMQYSEMRTEKTFICYGAQIGM